MQRIRSGKIYRVLDHIRVGIINNIVENIKSINTRIAYTVLIMVYMYCGCIILEVKHVSHRTKGTGQELDRMRVRRSIGDAELNLKKPRLSEFNLAFKNMADMKREQNLINDL
jgi:hypothetical protein